LRRLSEALGAVHGQGLVHGRIDGRAVYSAGAATKADFRLGGFEFCLRVAELDKAPLRVIAKSRPVGSVIFSFLDDWRALGRVLADLIGLDADKLDDEEARFLEGRPKIDLRASEIDLIRLLFQPERNRVLDAPTVTSRIDASAWTNKSAFGDPECGFRRCIRHRRCRPPSRFRSSGSGDGSKSRSHRKGRSPADDRNPGL
jgi:hypothetical protein